MPQLYHGEFHDSVVFICKHDKEGSVGFVINQPVQDFTLYSVFSKSENMAPDNVASPLGRKLLWGGGVDAGQLWIIHSNDQSWPHTVKINGHCSVTANVGTVNDILSGVKVPKDYLLLIGRVEWKPGSLIKEVQNGLWLTLPFDRNTLFSSSCQWDSLMGTLGTDRLTLSPIAGTA